MIEKIVPSGTLGVLRSYIHMGMGLFLFQEILHITGVTITETGEPGKGARCEIAVPKWAYRCS